MKTKGLQSFDDAPIVAVSLKSGERKNVLDGGTGPSYSSTGHLVYARGGDLLAVPFDVSRLAVTGAPFTALEGVSHSRGTGSAHYALSGTGTLVSLPGSVDVDNRMLVRSDPQGRMETLTRETRPFLMVRTSPDGRRLALWIGTADDEIWTYEIDRGILARLVPGATNPVWSPDGQWIVFSGARRDDDLGRVRADGSGAPEPLLTRTAEPDPLFDLARREVPRLHRGLTRDRLGRLDALPRHARDAPRPGDPLQRERSDVLPRRRLLTYVSDETGHNEVYVQPFPGPGARRQVSVGGGTSPVWGRPQGEIFYQNGTAMMTVSVQAGVSLQSSPPRKVFDGVLPLDLRRRDGVLGPRTGRAGLRDAAAARAETGQHPDDRPQLDSGRREEREPA